MVFHHISRMLSSQSVRAINGGNGAKTTYKEVAIAVGQNNVVSYVCMPF